jgi:hypothetical protein
LRSSLTRTCRRVREFAIMDWPREGSYVNLSPHFESN